MKTDYQGSGGWSGGCHGSVLLEFVVVFPVVLLVFFACMQVADLWVARLVTRYAAYAAARAALVHVATPLAMEGPTPKHDSWPAPARQLKHEGLEAPYRRGLNRLPELTTEYARTEAEWAANQVAAAVCSWVSKGRGGGDVVPSPWGGVPASGPAARKTRVSLAMSDWTVTARVEHDYALVFPGVGAVMAWGMDPWDRESPYRIRNRDMTDDVHGPLDRERYPHVRFLEEVRMPKPYHTIHAVNNWHTP